MIKIIKAKQSDIPEVKILVADSLREYHLEFDPLGTDKDLEDIQEEYFNNKGVFKTVIKQPGREIIACYGLYRIANGTCELRKMYLTKDMRGKGVGRQMMNDAFIEAKRLGYKKIILETNSILKEAVSMYKKYGFVEYSPEHLSSRCNLGMYKVIS